MDQSLESESNNNKNNTENQRCQTSKTFILFCCQMFILTLVCICALVNLSLPSTPEQASQHTREIWIGLLSSCVGYILPNPSYKKAMLLSPVMKGQNGPK